MQIYSLEWQIYIMYSLSLKTCLCLFYYILETKLNILDNDENIEKF